MPPPLVPIHTNLSFPTTASPSLGCLQWSSDGQVFVLTKSSVYIMTPNYPAILKSPKSSSISHDMPPEWFRTIIEFDKTTTQGWQELSQDWGAVAIGSLDFGLQALAISPSGLATDGGCLAAILTTNMDLVLWAPGTNRLQGRWLKIQDVTPLPSHGSVRNRLTVKAQVTSITWSQQADFGIDPTPNLDASLLAVGTRGGSLVFFRFERGALHCVDEIKVMDNWVIELTFSPWTLVEEGKCEACLACGSSDGAVMLLSVSQFLTSIPSITAFGPALNINVGYQVQVQQVLDPDKRLLTALKWIVCKGNRILVVCKPGVVSLIAPPSNTLGWAGHRALSLRPQKVSIGSSSLHPVSGVHYVPAEDALLVCLFDGSVHVVHHILSEPSLSAEVSRSGLCSHKLSVNARLAFDQTQPGKIRYTDANRIYGLLPFSFQGSLLWLQKSCQPTGFDYNYDAKQHSIFVAAQLWRSPDNESFTSSFATALSTAKPAGGAPIHHLRPFLFYLLDHREVFSDVVRLLQYPSISSTEFILDTIPPVPHLPLDLDPLLRLAFRRSISRFLLGSEQLLHLRMKLIMADILLRLMPNGSARLECEHVACYLFNVISQIILRTLIRHLTPIARVLTWKDAVFVLRLTSQASSPTCPPGLVAEAQHLDHMIRPAFKSLSTGQENFMSEICPACNAIILLESEAPAVCVNAHSWGRCSVTSSILSTGMVRKCTGCGRKALLPLSCKTVPSAPSWLPPSAQSWIVEELLEAASRCLFCGDIFVSSL